VGRSSKHEESGTSRKCVKPPKKKLLDEKKSPSPRGPAVALQKKEPLMEKKPASNEQAVQQKRKMVAEGGMRGFEGPEMPNNERE